MNNMKIRNFTYNGFMGKVLEGYANYTANFEKWSNDPGIAYCRCSDNVRRLIPSFAFEGVDFNSLPKQEYDNGRPTLFGQATKS